MLLKEGDGATEDSGVDLLESGPSGVEPDGHRNRIMEEMIGIRRYLFEKLHLNFARDETDTRHLPKVLDTVDFDGVMKHWNENKFKKIISMVGAGISTCELVNIIVKDSYSHIES